MATVDEDIEGELSQRLWIDDQVPRARDSGPEIGDGSPLQKNVPPVSVPW
jgi:hypothetical protein